MNAGLRRSLSCSDHNLNRHKGEDLCPSLSNSTPQKEKTGSNTHYLRGISANRLEIRHAVSVDPLVWPSQRRQVRCPPHPLQSPPVIACWTHFSEGHGVGELEIWCSRHRVAKPENPRQKEEQCAIYMSDMVQSNRSPSSGEREIKCRLGAGASCFLVRENRKWPIWRTSKDKERTTT